MFSAPPSVSPWRATSVYRNGEQGEAGPFLADSHYRSKVLAAKWDAHVWHLGAEKVIDCTFALGEAIFSDCREWKSQAFSFLHGLYYILQRITRTAVDEVGQGIATANDPSPLSACQLPWHSDFRNYEAATSYQRQQDWISREVDAQIEARSRWTLPSDSDWERHKRALENLAAALAATKKGEAKRRTEQTRTNQRSEEFEAKTEEKEVSSGQGGQEGQEEQEEQEGQEGNPTPNDCSEEIRVYLEATSFLCSPPTIHRRNSGSKILGTETQPALQTHPGLTEARDDQKAENKTRLGEREEREESEEKEEDSEITEAQQELASFKICVQRDEDANANAQVAQVSPVALISSHHSPSPIAALAQHLQEEGKGGNSNHGKRGASSSSLIKPQTAVQNRKLLVPAPLALPSSCSSSSSSSSSSSPLSLFERAELSFWTTDVAKEGNRTRAVISRRPEFSCPLDKVLTWEPHADRARRRKERHRHASELQETVQQARDKGEEETKTERKTETRRRQCKSKSDKLLKATKDDDFSEFYEEVRRLEREAEARKKQQPRTGKWDVRLVDRPSQEEMLERRREKRRNKKKRQKSKGENETRELNKKKSQEDAEQQISRSTSFRFTTSGGTEGAIRFVKNRFFDVIWKQSFRQRVAALFQSRSPSLESSRSSPSSSLMGDVHSLPLFAAAVKQSLLDSSSSFHGALLNFYTLSWSWESLVPLFCALLYYEFSVSPPTLYFGGDCKVKDVTEALLSAIGSLEMLPSLLLEKDHSDVPQTQKMQKMQKTEGEAKAERTEDCAQDSFPFPRDLSTLLQALGKRCKPAFPPKRASVRASVSFWNALESHPALVLSELEFRARLVVNALYLVRLNVVNCQSQEPGVSRHAFQVVNQLVLVEDFASCVQNCAENLASAARAERSDLFNFPLFKSCLLQDQLKIQGDQGDNKSKKELRWVFRAPFLALLGEALRLRHAFTIDNFQGQSSLTMLIRSVVRMSQSWLKQTNQNRNHLPNCPCFGCQMCKNFRAEGVET